MLKSIRKEFDEKGLLPEPPKRTSASKSMDEFFARLVSYLMERNVPISQGPMAELILEKLEFGTINFFLDHNPHLKITSNLIDSALLNADHYEIMWLLHHKAHQPNPQVNGLIEQPLVITHPSPEPTCSSQDCDMLHHPIDRVRRSRLQENPEWRTTWNTYYEYIKSSQETFNSFQILSITSKYYLSTGSIDQ